MIRKIMSRLGLPLAALISGIVISLTPSFAGAATIPLINVQAGLTPPASSGGVAGYYGADDGHTHYRYVQAIVTASPSLVNLSGTTLSGAAGAELCDENTGWAAQIGLYSTSPGHYNVAFADSSGTGGGIPLNTTFDDACIDGGMVQPNISLAAHFSTAFSNQITTGDKILVSVYYNPHGIFGQHQVIFSVTDLSKTNEHRSITNLAPAQSLSEFGIGVLSNAANVTADTNNLVDTFGMTKVNYYSSAKPAYPIIDQKAFYGYAGLSQVQYVNVSSQPEISPLSTLTADGFSVFEGSTTP